MDRPASTKSHTFVNSLKLRAIKTVKTSGLLSFHPPFHYLHHQAIESQVREHGAKVRNIPDIKLIMI